MNTNVSLIAVLAVGVLAGCATAPSYRSEKSETSATIVQHLSRVPSSLSVTEAVVFSIDGEAVEIPGSAPVYVSPGPHEIIFRFRVPEAPKETVHHRVMLTVEEKAVYHMRARYMRYSEPEPSIDFSVVEGEKPVYRASITF